MMKMAKGTIHLIGSLLIFASMMLLAACDDDDEPIVPQTDMLNIAVSSPTEGDVYFLGDSILLQGSASDESGAVIVEEDLSWSSDMDGFIGTGSLYWKNGSNDTTDAGVKASLLSINDHIITFTAIHPSGETKAVKAINISVDIEEIKAINFYGSNPVIAGKMDKVSGSSVFNIASWDGSAWSGLGGGVFRFPEVMAVSGTDLYVAGSLTLADGQTVNNIASWNGNSWSGLGDGVSNSDESIISKVTSIAAEGSDVYVGGDFNTAGGVGVSGIAWWNGASWSNMGAGLTHVEEDVIVASIATNSQGQVFVGGLFDLAGTIAVENIAMWDGTVWDSLGTGVTGGELPSVSAMALSPDGDLYVGGHFANAGWDTFEVIDTTGGANDTSIVIAPLKVSHIARWNGAAWSNLGNGLAGGPRPTATTIVIDNMGVVYVIGNFNTVNGPGGIDAQIGVYDQRILADSTWSALDLTGGPTDVTQIATDGTDLYVIDNMITLWRWNGSVWDSLGTAGE